MLVERFIKQAKQAQAGGQPLPGMPEMPTAEMFEEESGSICDDID